MTQLSHLQDAFVVVATGAGARTFHVHDGALVEGAEWATGDLADDGPSGKSPPDMSPRELNEATFSKLMAEKLYKLAVTQTFDKLILIADPNTLGEMRPLLHLEVKNRLVLEQAKTLTNSSVADIEKSIAGAGAG